MVQILGYAKIRDLRTTKPKILGPLERILLGGFLGVPCVLAVNADLLMNRQVAKDAKKTPSNTIWLRLRVDP